MVDELIPGYAESSFWIEPQTRVCRARMLLAEGDVARRSPTPTARWS